jgi:single-strand DNA-binding protein
MASVNKVILIGNAGKDPEIRYAPSGDAVVNLSIATTEKWKDKSGQPQEKTEWHNLVFFGRVAEIVNEYVTKGTSIYVEGKLQTRKWQGSDGQDRYTTEINVRELTLLGSRPTEGGAPAAKSQPTQRKAAPSKAAAPAGDFDDDIPF